MMIHRDVKENVFHPIFYPSIVFFCRIERDCKVYENEKYIQSVRKRLFFEALGEEIGDYLVLNLGRVIAGDKPQRFCMGIGHTNTGKSTIASA